MRRRAVLLAPLILLLVACAGAQHRGELTEKAYDYFDWEIRFTAAVKTLTAARAAGTLDDTTFRWIDPVLQEGNELLDKIHKQVDSQMIDLEITEPIEVDVDLLESFMNVLEKVLYLAARYS